jgi:hypothetical protein
MFPRNIIFLLLLPFSIYAQTPTLVAPLVPGTYTLNDKTEAEAAKSGGPYGKLVVSAASNNKCLFHLRYSTGAPANHLGLIKDSLTVYGSKTYYRPADDPACRVIFEFSEEGVQVKQESAGTTFACGFGKNVYVDGFYKRNKVTTNPTIRTGTHDIEIYWAEWMSWDKPGKATVTSSTNGKFTIAGKQIGRDNKGYMTINGTLQLISANTMEFNGTIVSQEAIINGGKICKREGKIRFTANSKKKKWIMNKVQNWGGQTVDEYITINF